MPIDWKTAYAAAIREQNAVKLPDLCDDAREKISQRILELSSKRPRTQEREDLDEALHQLVIHELKRNGAWCPRI